MSSLVSLLFCLLLVSKGSSAVITGKLTVERLKLPSDTFPWLAKLRVKRRFSEKYACELDSQCGGGMCCAVSLWIRSLRMCAPMGQEGDNCHPMSHKVPFFGKRLHHTCPCLPNLVCIATEQGEFKCLSTYKYQDYYL